VFHRRHRKSTVTERQSIQIMKLNVDSHGTRLRIDQRDSGCASVGVVKCQVESLAARRFKQSRRLLARQVSEDYLSANRAGLAWIEQRPAGCG
jgi:hypothetical protein